MVELQIVVLAVAGSSPVGHPTFRESIGAHHSRVRRRPRQQHRHLRLSALRTSILSSLSVAVIRTSVFLLALVRVAMGAWTAGETTPLSAPGKVTFRRIDVTNGDRQVRLHAVTFSAQDCTFALMDDPEGAYDLASAARKRRALAAVNGGYFHPDRSPLGLRIRQGREIHPLERAKLLSGLMTVSAGNISLLRTGEFTRTAAVREAVQAGPFLVDRGRPVAGLNGSRHDARTAIVAGPKQQFGLVIMDRTTLADAAAILSTPSILGNWSVVRALNLDGGSSTGLWVAGDDPFYHREWRDVRDFVAIVPR
jgi:Phosphodiester glycosidase